MHIDIGFNKIKRYVGLPRHLASYYAYVGHSDIYFIYFEIKIIVIFNQKEKKNDL